MKSKNIKKLADAVISNLEYLPEEGIFDNISLDYKRPYGNSDIESDILEILGEKKNPEYDEWSRKQETLAVDTHKKVLSYIKKQWKKLPKD